jgi:Divergent InlB B-repeat domain
VRAVLAVAAVAAALAAAPTSVAAVAPVRWCGNDLSQVDRKRDRLGGPQIHVVYAFPADGQNRFGELASALATDVAAIDAWWRREDPTRAPRFDLFEFPGCDSRGGLLDLSQARLARPSVSYRNLDGRFERIADELGGPPFSFSALDKKYLVFYDGPVGADDVCGTASGGPTLGGRFSYAIIYLRSTCGLTVGVGGGAAYVAAHELTHMLGAVEDRSPNSCNSGHVCDDDHDLMAAFYDGSPLDAALLDLGRNDYYAHPGSWFDVQNSRWLLRTGSQFALTLRVTGSGTVGSEPDGQGCVAVCATEWDGGTSVQLAAQPAAGFAFAGWSGACAGSREPSCLVSVDRNLETAAIFRPLRRLTLSLRGRGTVTSAGLRCARSCSTQRVEGTQLSLRAAAARGWRFVGWTGACGGTRTVCVVRLAAAARVGAVFARRS